MANKDITEIAQKVLDIEANAILKLKERINEDFHKACQIIHDCKGHVVVIGMGKSGHIGSKIAATLASTGTPAFFVHPSEASHGDIGMLTHHDVVLMLSYSGHTKEIIDLLPVITGMNIPLIGMSGDTTSPLAKASAAHLNVAVDKEACSLGLAPTSSSTASLVMGDALAVTLLSLRDFTKEDFAKAHPGGSLGKKLLLQVKDIMHQGKAIPIVGPEQTLDKALIEMNTKRLGFTTIVDPINGTLTGIFTDGDLRRTLDLGLDIHTTQMQEVMNTQCITTLPETLATDTLAMMNKRRITVLVVVDGNDKPVGVIHMHDLLQHGLTL